jgi:zinc transport system substrate-binding protein
MYRHAARLALVLLVGALAASVAVPAGHALDVVVTIKPLHSLVARVMAGAGEPHLLVQGALSAHTYVLKPSDAARLNAADVLFRMSEAMEPFTARVVRSLPSRVQVVTLEETPALRVLERRTGATFEEPGDADGHHHRHEPIDGHAWLDPVNAKAMSDRIAAALSASEPAQAARFHANAERLKTELDALDRELAGALGPVAGKPFLVFHDALQYFELRYGLKAAGSIAISPEVPPGARRLATLRHWVASQGAACVFAEPQFDTRLVSALVEGTPARVGTIDPEGSRIAAGPDHYFELLRGLARDLRACLASAG